MSRRSMITAVFAGMLLLAACGTEDRDGAADAPEPPAQEDEIPDEAPDEDAEDEVEEPADEEGRVETDLSAEVEMAIEDATSAEGVTEEDVRVLLAEHVTWRDGSLGCPEPDGMYTQALVEGYRVILAVGDQQYAYHGADGEEPFYCADPTEPADDGGVSS
jgi:hypothetical protein